MTLSNEEAADERSVVEHIRRDISLAFGEFRDHRISRARFDAKLSTLRARYRKLNTANLNYLSGYVSGWFHAIGEPE